MSDFLSLTLVANRQSPESCATSELKTMIFSAHPSFCCADCDRSAQNAMAL